MSLKIVNKDDFINELKKLGDPTKAIDHKRYHKSNREHWGVSAPKCEQLVKTVSKGLDQKELLSLAEALWMTNLFDPMMCAAKIMSLTRLKPSTEVWTTVKNFLLQVDGWALEDSLAHVAWKCILADKNLLKDLEKWTTHPDFWMRRATLVYTLPFAKPGKDPELMLEWASSYSNDSEWFIQKAIGWWLRVLGEHNPERVLRFLQGHWPQLKTVAKTEATRKLPKEFQMKAKSL